MRVVMLVLLVAAGVWAKDDFQAGVGKVEITPQGPIWMAGYAARTKPSEGVLAPLYVKALAIADGKKEKVVLVGTDIIGYPRQVADRIAVEALKRYGLERRQLLLNASHTHSGPVVWPNLSSMYFMNAEQQKKVEDYALELVEKTVTAIGAALGDLKAAQIEVKRGQANFGTNRRKFTPTGVANSPNPEGMTDHGVPMIQVKGKDGKTRAVLFAYSCHNTTMTGEFYQLNGDYAGFAQAGVEDKLPGATAIFMTACAGDQNPNPRSSLEHAKKHGAELADAVVTTAGKPGVELKGQVRSAFQLVNLPFQPFERKDFEEELKSTNKFAVRRAEAVLKGMDERTVTRNLSYPIQVIKIGQQNLIALGGEVVVEYCPRLRRETKDEGLMVLGYSNEVMCYIPSKKVVGEGGYEAKESFMYYGQPAPLAAEVEEVVVGSAMNLFRKVK